MEVDRDHRGRVRRLWRSTGRHRFLVQQWLDTPEYRETLLMPHFSHFGFAERVNGEGRKVALAALVVSP